MKVAAPGFIAGSYCRFFDRFGTGDLYSSTVLGGLMRGMDLGDALALAADFVVICIEATAASKSARWYGVEFESQIPKLCKMVEERLKKG